MRIPKLYTSTFSSYGSPSTISGAMYKNDPVRVVKLLRQSIHSSTWLCPYTGLIRAMRALKVWNLLPGPTRLELPWIELL